MRRGCAVFNCDFLESAGCKVAHCSDKEIYKRCTDGKRAAATPSLSMVDYGCVVPKDWQQIHATRSWQSPNPDSEVQAASAWCWIQHWWAEITQAAEDEVEPAAKLEDGWVARLLQFRSVYVDLDSYAHYMVIASYKFCCNGTCSRGGKESCRALCICPCSASLAVCAQRELAELRAAPMEACDERVAASPLASRPRRPGAVAGRAAASRRDY